MYINQIVDVIWLSQLVRLAYRFISHVFRRQDNMVSPTVGIDIDSFFE
jgi:hypothetical protein